MSTPTSAEQDTAPQTRMSRGEIVAMSVAVLPGIVGALIAIIGYGRPVGWIPPLSEMDQWAPMMPLPFYGWWFGGFAVTILLIVVVAVLRHRLANLTAEDGA